MAGNRRLGRIVMPGRNTMRYGFSGTGKLHKVLEGDGHHSLCGLAYINRPVEEISLPPEYFDRCSKCFNIPKEERKEFKPVKDIIDDELANWCLRVGLKI